jgi:glycogen debranching enzyme
MQKVPLLLIVLLMIPISFASSENIAKENLRELYRDDGIFAGPNQFSDYWARDALFATLGSNAIGDYDISKKQLELFIKYQKDDGQIPMRVGDYDITLKLLGIDVNQAQRPRYDQDKLFTNPRDQNCLFVIAAEDYIVKSGDTQFAVENFHNFEDAISWLANKDEDNNFLVNEGDYAGWTDSVKKNGEVLYTNVCYYRSLKAMSNISHIVDNKPEEQLYDLWAKLVHKKINDEFWLDEGYYADWIYKGTKYTYFSTDGNTLAILWDVADEQQARSILSYSESNKLSDGFGVKTTYPEYKTSLISSVNIFAGISDYHTEMRWLWVSCLYTKALNEHGFENEANLELAEIKLNINQLGEIYEVYDSNGEPIDRLFYKSEHPFAWSSGVCTWVFEDFN